MSKSDKYINNPLNNSPSKYTHAFPSAERFIRIHRLSTQHKYNLPSTLDKKSAGFGIGNKISLVLKRCSPPPGTYQSRSDFSTHKNKPHSPGIGFGRNQVLFGSFLKEAEKRNVKIPSPTKYDIQLAHNKIGGRIGIRLATQFETRQGNNFPGPGAYNMDSIQMAHPNSFILSNLRKSPSVKYYQQSKTIDVNRGRKLAPIIYNVSEKDLGKSRTSKFRNCSVTIFSKSKRLGIEDRSKINVPGFKYQLFSQFGTNHK